MVPRLGFSAQVFIGAQGSLLWVQGLGRGIIMVIPHPSLLASKTRSWVFAEACALVLGLFFYRSSADTGGL